MRNFHGKGTEKARKKHGKGGEREGRALCFLHYPTSPVSPAASYQPTTTSTIPQLPPSFLPEFQMTIAKNTQRRTTRSMTGSLKPPKAFAYDPYSRSDGDDKPVYDSDSDTDSGEE